MRPPVSYTDSLKVKRMKEYGSTDSIKAHEEDHLISLEFGGDPRHPKNLWPEPGASPNPKDKVENELHALVCDRKLPLAEAQQRIASDWTTALTPVPSCANTGTDCDSCPDSDLWDPRLSPP